MSRYAFYILTSLLLSGCYSYPNYDIIKPEKSCSIEKENILKQLESHFGKPYVWAEEGPDAFDCSGLIYSIYGNMGVVTPRVAREQAKMGKEIKFKDLYYGDLIFFGSTNRRSKYINHVGIYLKDGWFAHASSKDRVVTMTNFEDEPKYFKRIKVCKRYISKNSHTVYSQCDTPLIPMGTTSTLFTSPWEKGMSLPLNAVPR